MPTRSITNDFSWLNGFGILTSISTIYYLADNNGNRVYVLDDNWVILRYANFISPANILVVGNFVYISSDDDSFYKMNSNLDVLVQYALDPGSRVRGIYFNSTNNLIYLAATFSHAVFRFDLDLNLYDSFSTHSHFPYSINGFKNKLYVGDSTSGLILVMINNIIVNTFNGCFGNSVAITMISLDQNGFMANVCEGSNSVYLYNVNGTYANYKLSTETTPEYIGMDSKGRVFVVSQYQVTIY